jgi:hypothetical protein
MISILCPVTYYHDNIFNAINSVLSQTYKSWELLIGYKDNLYENMIELNEFLTKWNINNNNKIKIYKYDTSLTKIDILNKLKEDSNYESEWIAVKDISDCWLYDKLSQQMFIAAGNEYSVIGTNYMLDDQFMKVGKKIPVRNISNINFLEMNPLINSSVIIKKELCNWTNKWLYNEEYELFIILWMNKFKYYNLSNPYIQINIDAYLHDKTPNKNYYKNSMINYYKTLIHSLGNKSSNSSFFLNQTCG